MARPVPQIVFCVEAAQHIGYGHLSRCLSLAVAFGNHVEIAFFLVAGPDPNARDLVLKSGFWLVDILPDTCRVVVFDGYGFTDNQISAARQSSRGSRIVILIDDLGGREVDCDLIVCPGPQRAAEDYRVPKNCQLLLGPDYAIINPAFQTVPIRDFAETVMRVFIGFGGSDPLDASARTLAAITAGHNLCIDMVLGSGYVGALNGEFRPPTGMDLHRSLTANAVASLMARCDAALAAPGTMSLELASLARPSLLFAISPTQVEAGVALRRVGLCDYAGVIADYDAEMFRDRVATFLKDVEGRKAMRQACLRATPSKGVNRVADAIKSLMERVIWR